MAAAEWSRRIIDGLQDERMRSKDSVGSLNKETMEGKNEPVYGSKCGNEGQVLDCLPRV